jgi:mycofactocin system glycosyltransferase
MNTSMNTSMTATMTAGPTRTQLPDGFAVRLATTTRARDGGRTLFGGSPARILYLRPRGARLLADGTLTVSDAGTARLARLLLDRGLADPLADATGAAGPTPYDACDVSAVVPVRDRPDQLARLLATLPPELTVVVVDDGSADPRATLRVARIHGARLLRHPVSRGPAAARNTGLRAVGTPLVAFLDSDVVPRPGWLDPLLDLFRDPAVGIAAPRIAGLDEQARGGAIARYEAARSSLDLGPQPGLVAPRGRVPYLPSACLVGRTIAFGAGFDEAMHVGEDVDLVWRTVAAGWRVRYQPASVVDHEHRTRTRAWLARKAFYGTSAAPLALRHGDAVAPVVVSPWTAAVAVVLLGQRRWSVPVAGAIAVGATGRLSRKLRHSPRPLVAAARLAPYGVVSALWQSGAAATRHWWPVALPAAVASRRVRRAVLAVAVLDGLADWRRTKPDLDPARYLVLRRLDDLAYGAGLWRGALRHRTTAPLRPSLRGSTGDLDR